MTDIDMVILAMLFLLGVSVTATTFYALGRSDGIEKTMRWYEEWEDFEEEE